MGRALEERRVFHGVEPLRGSVNPNHSFLWVARPLTLGCGIKPLRGIRYDDQQDWAQLWNY